VEKRLNSMFSRIIMKRKDQPVPLVWSGVAFLGQGEGAKVGRKTRRADCVANSPDFFASVLSRFGDMVLPR